MTATSTIVAATAAAAAAADTATATATVQTKTDSVRYLHQFIDVRVHITPLVIIHCSNITTQQQHHYGDRANPQSHFGGYIQSSQYSGCRGNQNRRHNWTSVATQALFLMLSVKQCETWNDTFDTLSLKGQALDMLPGWVPVPAGIRRSHHRHAERAVAAPELQHLRYALCGAKALTTKMSGKTPKGLYETVKHENMFKL